MMSQTKNPAHPFLLALLLPVVACGDDGSIELVEGTTEGSSGAESSESASPDTDHEPPASEESDSGELPSPMCGNELVEDGEACDDGDRNGEPGSCANNCLGAATWCGDGEVGPGEVCDDGNDVDGDGCNVDCRASGTLVWERSLELPGQGRAVDVGPDGAIYAAGFRSDGTTQAWAARLDADGEIVWTHDGSPDGSMSAVMVSDDEIRFGGQRSGLGRVITLDHAGQLRADLPMFGIWNIEHLAELPDGDLLIKAGSMAYRVDGLATPWSMLVGRGLAYRPEGNVALAATEDSAGFKRFTPGGLGLAPVTFPMPMDVSSHARAVAWTSTDEVVVAGLVSRGGATEALVAKSSVDGRLEWMYGPEQLHAQVRYVTCLAVDSQDAVVVGGFTEVLGTIRPLVMKLSSEGALLWIQHLDFEATDAIVWGCTTTATDEIVTVGEADGHIWAAKLTP